MTRNTTISPSVPTTRSPLQRAWGPRFAHGLFLLASATACGQEPLCEELGDCGGEFPVGSWGMGPKQSSCSEDLYTPPKDKRIGSGATLPAKGFPFADQAFYDWCYELIAGSGDNIAEAQTGVFYLESPKVGDVGVRYEPFDGGRRNGYDGTYFVGFTKTGTFRFDFPAICMRQFGAKDDKPAIGEDGFPVKDGMPTNVCKQLEVPQRNAGIGEGSYRNTTCKVNSADPGGCICEYDNAATGGGGSGKYKILSKNEILHVPSTPGFSQKATFCRTGDRLQLTGSDGTYLFDQLALRTLDLGFYDCDDGAQGSLEEGVDCGRICGTTCMPAP